MQVLRLGWCHNIKSVDPPKQKEHLNLFKTIIQVSNNGSGSICMWSGDTHQAMKALITL